MQSLIQHTRLYESPTIFWEWAAYSAIAGVLRDNIWMKSGDGRLFPNIYTLFLISSGGKKGWPVKLAEELVYTVGNVNIISGRASIQAILTELGHTETNKDGRIRKGGAAIFFAPELSAGIVEDKEAIQILTDIYDYKATPHTTFLIGRGKAKLEQLVFSILAASNEELLKDFFTSKAIYGGLLARLFLVIPNEYRYPNPRPERNEAEMLSLIAQLLEISKLSGIVSFNQESGEFYDQWYVDFTIAARKKVDKPGILARIPTHVKKLGMILAANDLSLVITKKHVEEAIDICIKLLPNYRAIALQGGKSDIAEAGVIIFEYLRSREILNYKDLIRENWGTASPEIFDKALSAFEISGLIQTTVSGSERAFQLTAKGREILGK